MATSDDRRLPFPSIYLLPARLTGEERRRLEEQIPSLTTDASKADVFLGRLSRRERALFELRRLGVQTADSVSSRRTRTASETATTAAPAAKRRKLGERTPSPIVISSSSSDEAVDVAEPARPASPGPVVRVVKLAWFTDSVACGQVLPLTGSYVVYEGRRLPRVDDKPSQRQPSQSQPSQSQPSQSQSQPSQSQPSQLQPSQLTRHAHRRPPLVQRTTSEHDEAQDLPPVPAFLHTPYSCQRRTPVHPPNEAFVNVLRTIRAARELTGDRIGIRAYSTAIATLSAYPYALSVPAEVSRLPGCGPKIAELFREFQQRGGRVGEAEADAADAQLAVLRLFSGIWGVAAATARAFYNRGWRDLDDVVEFGWTGLTRVQQIGVKYYDELQQPVARAEAEAIAARVLAHANRLCPGHHMVLAGGFRRGQERGGDVDVLLSHPHETATHLLVGRLVPALEAAGLITHTLTLSTANSERGQQAVSWKGNAPRHGLETGVGTTTGGGSGGSGGGGGFDTLDKALVVWQEPMEPANAAGAAAKNTNPHRRVDIIVSPWKTVGCALLGWSGGTTFQRDLRRYCKNERNLRFDSSGARSRLDGSWVDLEDYGRDPAPDMLTAERRVFAALGLEYIPPSERCTG